MKDAEDSSIIWDERKLEYAMLFQQSLFIISKFKCGLPFSGNL